jgi:hypothetical protein
MLNISSTFSGRVHVGKTNFNGIRQLHRIWDTTCIVYIYGASIKRVYLKGIHLLRRYNNYTVQVKIILAKNKN